MTLARPPLQCSLVLRRHLDDASLLDLAHLLFASLDLTIDRDVSIIDLRRSHIDLVVSSLVATIAITRDIPDESHHLIVVFLFDRVDFVVVTTRAIEGEPQDCLPHRRNNVIVLVEPSQKRIRWFVIPDAQSVESSRSQRFRRNPFDLISRNLFSKKVSVGFVFIERRDHVVAVLVRIGFGIVPLETIRLCITDKVEPMPSPAFSEMRIGQQLIHPTLVRFFTPLANK